MDFEPEKLIRKTKVPGREAILVRPGLSLFLYSDAPLQQLGPSVADAIEAYQAFVPKDALKTHVASDGNRKKITPKVIAADLKTLRKIPKNYEAYEFHYGHDEDAGGPFGIRFDATWLQDA